MTAVLLPYLLKSNLAFGVLFGTWLLLFRRSTRFKANRWVLLGSCICAMLLPLLPDLPEPMRVVAIDIPALVLPVGTNAPVRIAEDRILYLYLAGFAVALIVFMERLIMTLAWARRIGQDEAFSFFQRIGMPEDLPPEDRAAMLAHEQVHVRRGHSYDVLLLELLAATSWFNPLWRWAISEMRMVHEHEADAEARHVHPDYERLLVARALGLPSTSLMNSFRSRTLKTRIAMLQRDQEPHGRGWKFTWMLPAMALALLTTGWKAVPLRAGISSTTGPEKEARFPGGAAGLQSYMKNTLKYPGPLTPSGPGVPEGITLRLTETVTVPVQFTIDRNGQVKDVKALKNEGPFADEAIRAVKGMPKWEPATTKGQPVESEMVLPVRFQPE